MWSGNKDERARIEVIEYRWHMTGDALSIFLFFASLGAAGAIAAITAPRGWQRNSLWSLAGVFFLAALVWLVRPSLVPVSMTVLSAAVPLISVIYVWLMTAGLKQALGASARARPISSPSQATRAKLPEMKLGDAIRYIATSSTWPALIVADEEWPVALEQELIDQLSKRTLTASGRFTANRYGGHEGTASLGEIDKDFWDFATIEAKDYFLAATDKNRVWKEGYGYYDVRFYEEDVKRVWPPATKGERRTLPHLAEALAVREKKMAQKTEES